MLHLKTAAGERLEIPAGCIIAVIKPCGGESASAVAYDMGFGQQLDQLSDQYGFVKKNVIDSMAIVNPIEVRHIEGTIIATTDSGSPIFGAPYNEGRMFFSRSLITGRREVKDEAIPGCKSRLFVNLLGGVMPINIADTLEELDGVETDDAPVAAPVPMTVPPEGA
ncbi:hypothetical protein [Novosphingobium sp. ZW T3_23]|uniref:hypothetical protein n=1 Tax=Novosphingobium sp. ZW T3_23 TaxID=3378084 RepID=UPI0038521290